MSQTSLKGLKMDVDYIRFQELPFTTYPGTMGLRNLSELKCNSSVDSEFYHQMSQICHRLGNGCHQFRRVGRQLPIDGGCNRIMILNVPEVMDLRAIVKRRGELLRPRNLSVFLGGIINGQLPQTSYNSLLFDYFPSAEASI